MEVWGEDEAPLDVRAEMTWEEYRDAARIEVDGVTGYVVEWDLMFETEEALHDYYDMRANGSVEKAHVWLQFSSDRILKRTALGVLHIRYCVSTSFADHATTAAAMATAVAGWEAVANVNFDYVPTANGNCVPENPNVDLPVMYSSWEGGGCATPPLSFWSGPLPATFPKCLHEGGRYLTGTLAMNPAGIEQLRIDRALPSLTLAGAFRHELGHVLGLQHEQEWRPGGNPCGPGPLNSSWDLYGRQLTDVAYDPDSVMHYQWCGPNTSHDFNITPTDAASMRALYGMPPAWYVPSLLR